MHRPKVAVLFPGQGAFYSGVLQDVSAHHPQIQAVFAEVDTVARRELGVSVSEVIFTARKPDIKELLAEHGDVLQLALYGIAVATYKILSVRGLKPSMLMGHSFGEIAAMVSGGAFSVRQGAEIVCHRVAALARLGADGGAMLALGADRHQAQQLVALLRNPATVIAGENHDRQTIISGANVAIAMLNDVAKALKLSSVVLNSPYPFHSPILQPCVADFAERLDHIPQAPLEVPIFSPILGRYYTGKDDLRACLAEHLVQPVNFAPAIERAYSEGVRIFVESGALDTLGNLVRTILKAKDDVETVTCLNPSGGELATLENAFKVLQASDCLPQEPVSPALDGLADRFWALHGTHIMASIDRELQAFWQSMVPDLTASSAAEPPPVIEFDTTMNRQHAAAAAAAADVAAAVAAPEAVPVAAAPTTKPAREQLFRELATLYADALEYPYEVFTEDVALESELGIDSVKQTELLARVSELYNLPPRSADFRLSNYPTIGKVTDFVHTMLP